MAPKPESKPQVGDPPPASRVVNTRNNVSRGGVKSECANRSYAIQVGLKDADLVAKVEVPAPSVIWIILRGTPVKMRSKPVGAGLLSGDREGVHGV